MDNVTRFIPAYAGNSLSTEEASLTQPVHPRLRGELQKRGRSIVGFAGSSPLTRGTLFIYTICC